MTYRGIHIAPIIFLGALLCFSPLFFSSAAARPHYVRIVVHEDRLHFEQAGCLDQHLKEHLYSRLVDKELADQGHTAFSVEAVAAIDKIIIGIEYWGESEELESIAQAATEGIKKHPPALSVRQERALVAYEDSLLAEAPSLGSSVTAALIATAAPSHFSCPAEQPQLTAGNLSNWAPGDFEVYKTEGTGQYTLLFSSRTSHSAFPNAWDSLSEPTMDSRSTSTAHAPNTLFLAYKGEAAPFSTTILLAAIYDAIDGTEVETKDVRPLGKSGFVIRAEGRVLAALRENLRTALSSPTSTQAQSENLHRAWESVCRFRTIEPEANAQISREQIAHPYFEFNAQGVFCDDGPDLGIPTSDLILISDLLFVAETGFRSPSYSSPMSLDLCIPEEGLAQEDLSIAAYALRQHFRFDLGLALNIQYSRIEGNCVAGSIFAPASNIAELERMLANFESANDAYAARFSTAAVIYHCSRGSPSACRRQYQIASRSAPVLQITVK